MREGRPLPKKIRNAPELILGLEFYYNAFEDLSSCRELGFGVGPIPWTAMKDYCHEYDITGDDDLEDFFYFIRQMDNAYLAHMAKSNKG